MDTGQNLANFIKEEKFFKFTTNGKKFKHLVIRSEQSNLLERFIEKEIISLEG